MKAVLLAAGLGTRLAPLTTSIPKILAPVRGRPLLDRQLRYLAANGVGEVIVNVHHHAEQVIDFLGRFEPPPVAIISREANLLGTAGALRPVSTLLTQSFVVLYGDVVTDADVRELMQGHRASTADATLAYYRSSDTVGKGVLDIGSNGRVTRFVEKPSADTAYACINAGLYALNPGILDLVEGEAPDFGSDIWPRAISYGYDVRGWELNGYIRDVGSPMALSALEDDIAARVLTW